jgi:hypothetical protein
VRLRQLGQAAAKVWNGSTGRWQGKWQATGRPFAFETLETSLEPPCGEIFLPQSASNRPLAWPGLAGAAVRHWPARYAPGANGRLPAAGPGGHDFPAGLDRIDLGREPLQPLPLRRTLIGRLPPLGRTD